MPVIDEDGITTDHRETRIDLSNRLTYGSLGARGSRYAAGVRYLVNVPYSGSGEIFYYRPSTYSLGILNAALEEGSLTFVYDRLPQEQSDLRSDIERDLDDLRKHLGWAKSDFEQFDSQLRATIENAIESRRKILLDAQKTAHDLGFPLRRRSDAPNTYAPPQVQRKIIPKLPRARTTTGALEPALDMENYEHILSIMSNMVTVMERSPSAFAEMKEEDIRQHFLVQLNGHYEGQATGETFNASGKTDILIRAEGKNIFIAECKFWNGGAGLSKAIDQLLSYTTWRDTKTALLVFNRDTQFSTVLSRIPQAVEAHPNCKVSRSYDSETGFRYILSQPSDPDREMVLTVLAFDIPAESG